MAVSSLVSCFFNSSPNPSRFVLLYIVLLNLIFSSPLIAQAVENVSNGSNSDASLASTSSTSSRPLVEIRKCCRSGQALKYDDSLRCTPIPGLGLDWTPNFYFEDPGNADNGAKNLVMKTLESNPILEFAGTLRCQHWYLEQAFPYALEKLPKTGVLRDKYEAEFMRNGEVLRRLSGNQNFAPIREEFCVDGLITDFPANETANSSSFFQPQKIPPGQFDLKSCVLNTFPASFRFYDEIVAWSYFFRALSPLLHVIIYGLLWREQNLHGWTIVMFSACSFLTCILKGGGFFVGFPLIWQRTPLCYFFSVAWLYFFMAGATWMTIISFDVWSTITSMTTKAGRSKGYKRFLWYCLVGFGFPAVVVATSVGVDLSFGFWDPRVRRPQFGHHSCTGVTAEDAYWIFDSLPNTTLFMIQFIFAALTVRYVLTSLGEGSKITSSRKKNAMTQAKRIGKLLILTDLINVCETGFRLVSTTAYLETSVFEWIRLFFDVVNALVPWLILHIFVWRREIRDQLSGKYPVMKKGFKWLDGIGIVCCRKKKTSHRAKRGDHNLSKSSERDNASLSSFSQGSVTCQPNTVENAGTAESSLEILSDMI